MNIILLVLLIVYQTVVAITDMHDIKKYKCVNIAEKTRIDFYKESIIWGWIPVLIILLFSAFTSMSLQDMGLRKIELSPYLVLNGLVFGIAGVIILLLLYQMIMYFVSDEFRKKSVIELENKKNSDNHYDNIVLNLLIPYTIKEKNLFFFVSLTAGICEEIFIRGCMIFLLQDIFPNFNIAVVVMISSIVFGLFHCYQGVYGIIKTGLIGIFFAGLYIATDSLIPGMILHFFMDFSSAFIVKKE